MKRKIQHVVLALALCGTLGACGGPPPGDPNSDSANGGLNGSGAGAGNGSGSYTGVCKAEGSWSDTDGNTNPESALGGGNTRDEAEYNAISNCNQIVEVSVSTFNGSHVDDDVGGVSDGSCQVTSCD